MNILINSNRPIHIQSENDDETDNSRFGERFAAAFVIFYTSSALLASAVSVVVMRSEFNCGGPAEHLIQLLKLTGIV